MVDLHQGEPGLPDGHPWKSFSRGQMAWRAFCGVSFAGLTGTLLFGLLPGGVGSPSAVGVLFGLGIPSLAAALAAAFGLWLRRYYPFSQALLFGGLMLVSVVLLATLLSLLEWAARRPCPADTLCAGPIDGALFALFLLGFPAFLSACIGFGTAIWAATSRGSKVFWPFFSVVALACIATLVLSAF